MILIHLYILWVFYLAVMNLQRAQNVGTLTKPALYLGYPVLMLGYLLDFTANMIPASIVFFDIPRELLVTGRLQRYVDGPDCRRRRMALWFARNLLDPFDPKGYHVKE